MPVAALLAPSTSGAPAAGAVSTIAWKAYALTDLTTPLGTLTQWFDDNTVDVLDDVGHGSLRLQNDDSQLTLCAPGNVLRKYVDTTAAFQFIIDHTVRRSLDPAEEVEHATTLSGDGIGQVFNRATVQPSRGYGTTPWSDARTFSFASPEYDASSWGTATAIVAHQADTSAFYTGLPAGWATPDATWIGPPDGDDANGYVGNVYLIGDHTFTDPTQIVNFLAADNKADVYGNGMALTEFGTDLAFTETHRSTLFVSAGAFRLAAKVMNFVDGGTDPGAGRGAFIPGNPIGFLSATYPVDGRGKLGPLAIQTDTAWKILAYPDIPPGWTVGGIIIQLITEAQAAGLLTGVTWDFDADVDTAGNAWDVLEAVTLTVGDDYLTVLRAFAGAYCDWAVAPDSLNLSMWRLGERGALRAFGYVAGTNLTSLTHDSVDVTADVLVVKWSGGQFRYPATGGTRETLFSAGDAKTLDEATRLADAQLALMGGTRTAFQADIEPASTTDQPYTGYTVGDIVTVPDETGAASLQRVTQIVGRTDENANPVWSPSFRDVHLDVAARTAQALTRMANGTLGGYSTVATLGGPAPTFGSKINASEVTFSVPDPVTTGEATKNKVASQSGNLYAVAITAKTAGSTDTELEFLLAGVDILNGGGVLPAGSQFVLIPVDYLSQSTAWVEGNTDTAALTVNITTVGTGVAGLLVEPRFL